MTIVEVKDKIKSCRKQVENSRTYRTRMIGKYTLEQEQKDFIDRQVRKAEEELDSYEKLYASMLKKTF
ncbi:hypothetical protein [Vallitalea guaymasensis]|uniref:hypothetical protein n=1 Tax=Vallitalea guaymasensis TaxID=1185412 RepID=UPI000DE2CF4B|nr:hypothetical protein [Vallitalea guaymasensis]